MFETTMRWIVAGYGFLLALAAGGLVMANVAGLLGAAIQFGALQKLDAQAMQLWIHSGWFLGVGLAFVGGVKPFLKQVRTDSTASKKSRQRTSRRSTAPRGKRHGRLASAGIAAALGALLGAMLGGSFLLIWFSITYSPFAPPEWVASLSLRERSPGESMSEGGGVSTDHPLALALFFTPMAVGAVAGSIFGAIGGVYEEK